MAITYPQDEPTTIYVQVPVYIREETLDPAQAREIAALKRENAALRTELFRLRLRRYRR